MLVDDAAKSWHPATQEHFGKPVPGSLPTIMRLYKAAVSRRTNELRNTPGALVWQRNYYEHIIRNEASLTRIRAVSPVYSGRCAAAVVAVTCGPGRVIT